jgi:ABC-type transport system involved in multi-copper enzyme maturation permease subunit
MNVALFRHVLRQYGLRLVVVTAALVAWGMLMPIIYAAFGSEMKALFDQFPQFGQFANFGGGNLFTLPGSIAVGYIHPIAIALLSVFAIVFPLSAVAGERQRGTLEVVLARPISRRSYYLTLFASAVLFIGILMAATLVGTLIAAALTNTIGELDVANIPALWLNGVVFYGAIAAIAFAASVSFDRVGPAAGITLTIVLVSYFMQVVGSLWPSRNGETGADILQPYSLFHYLDPSAILTDGAQVFDLVVLLVVGAIAVTFALIIFPRRDLAAPA